MGHQPRPQHLAAKTCGRLGAIGRHAARHGLHRQRHQRLRPQQAACSLGGVGVDHALAGLTVGVEGFKGIGGHGLTLQNAPGQQTAQVVRCLCYRHRAALRNLLVAQSQNLEQSQGLRILQVAGFYVTDWLGV